MNPRLLISTLSTLCTASFVIAQPAPADRPATPESAPGAAPFAQQPLSLSTAMHQNGGSLLRATLASSAPPDPTLADAPVTLGSVSFFTVPDPQPKKIAKHNLVTIVVREQSTFSSEGTTDLKKSAALDAKLDAFVAFRLSQMEIHGITPGGATVPEVKAEGSRDFKGEATVDRTDQFTARITAEVLDVKPNGNLVLQAVKQIRTDEELQRMILTGTCRAEDISADNTVLSTQLADVSLEKIHRGAVRDTTKRGFVPRLLDQLNPF